MIAIVAAVLLVVFGVATVLVVRSMKDIIPWGDNVLHFIGGFALVFWLLAGAWFFLFA